MRGSITILLFLILMLIFVLMFLLFFQAPHFFLILIQIINPSHHHFHTHPMKSSLYPYDSADSRLLNGRGAKVQAWHCWSRTHHLLGFFFNLHTFVSVCCSAMFVFVFSLSLLKEGAHMSTHCKRLKSAQDSWSTSIITFGTSRNHSLVFVFYWESYVLMHLTLYWWSCLPSSLIIITFPWSQPGVERLTLILLLETTISSCQNPIGPLCNAPEQLLCLIWFDTLWRLWIWVRSDMSWYWYSSSGPEWLFWHCVKGMSEKQHAGSCWGPVLIKGRIET